MSTTTLSIPTNLPTTPTSSLAQTSNSESTKTIASVAEDSSTPALVGGIVGGIIALLLAGALIAYTVARRRQQSKVSHTTGTDAAHSTIARPKPPKHRKQTQPLQTENSVEDAAPGGYSERFTPSVSNHYGSLNATEVY